MLAGGVRGRLVSALLTRRGDSARELFEAVRRQGVRCSYQAVHKALRKLVRDRVVEVVDGKYLLSFLWLRAVKSSLEKSGLG